MELKLLFSRSVMSDSATPWTAICQASLSFTISLSLLRLISIELMMPSNHLILCHLLLLFPSLFPSIRVFSDKSALHTRWPKYWSFSISPSYEYSGLISFRIYWFDLLAAHKVSVNTTLFGNRVLADVIKLEWGHIRLAWALVRYSCSYKKWRRDTETHKEKIMWQQRQSLEWWNSVRKGISRIVGTHQKPRERHWEMLLTTQSLKVWNCDSPLDHFWGAFTFDLAYSKILISIFPFLLLFEP